MDKYSVKSTHDALKKKLLDYIITEYFGKNDALRAACEKELHKQGVLYQEPYIEANHSYEVVKNGIALSKLEDDTKRILAGMIDRGLGVFKNPYRHQVEALEAYHQGSDLLVSTGTGSGKTECFLWPLVSKLAMEQIRTPDIWAVRGVRAIMLYPMNALVSDQLGRLRRMIGNAPNGFHSLISELAPDCRVPQFGMYTGRTPYPGDTHEKQNKELAETMKKDLLLQPDDVKKSCWSWGNIPPKRIWRHLLNVWRATNLS